MHHHRAQLSFPARHWCDVSMQADSFKYKPQSQQKTTYPYIFGVENAWVLAPTRDGAHNWDTRVPEAVTALECLSVPSAIAGTIPPVDRTVYCLLGTAWVVMGFGI